MGLPLCNRERQIGGNRYTFSTVVCEQQDSMQSINRSKLTHITVNKHKQQQEIASSFSIRGKKVDLQFK